MYNSVHSFPPALLILYSKKNHLLSVNNIHKLYLSNLEVGMLTIDLNHHPGQKAAVTV